MYFVFNIFSKCLNKVVFIFKSCLIIYYPVDILTNYSKSRVIKDKKWWVSIKVVKFKNPFHWEKGVENFPLYLDNNSHQGSSNYPVTSSASTHPVTSTYSSTSRYTPRYINSSFLQLKIKFSLILFTFNRKYITSGMILLIKRWLGLYSYTVSVWLHTII